MGREEVVRGLVRGFLDRLSAKVPAMRAALEKGDAEAIRFEAHAVKGGALNLRAHRLAEAALALERAVEERRMEDAAGLLDAFAAAAQELARRAAAVLVLAPGHLDDVVPERGGDDVAERPLRQPLAGAFEGGDHLARAEPPQVAPL
jgi:HPt (histidine-containing phosphotransfer) domain-containing protein